jgi:hypothetical protein
MSNSSSQDPAEAVRQQQQQDARRLFGRLESLVIADLTIHYTLANSSVILPALLVRFIVLSVLFRLNSAKKWRVALGEEFLTEPLRRWLGIAQLEDLVNRATVDWIPPAVLLDTLSWSRPLRKGCSIS